MNTHRKMNMYMFTASQLEELQHQVLIFKYMASGVQVPSHLLLNLTRSLDSTTRLFPHKQGFAAGLGLFHMGFIRKEVSEPGRCKRTDGKKWRCSKETHLDSKYCERHMHRGRNSSRKPVEIYATATTTTTKPITEIHSDSVPDCSFLQSSTLLHPASLFPPSSSRHPTTSSLSPRSSTNQQFLSESGSSYSQINNYRYLHATRDGETAFSMKVPETVRYQQESYLPSQIAYSDYFCHLKDHAKSEYQQRQDKTDPQQHCFILGDDFKPANTIKLDRGGDNPKRFHHFFSECPLKSKDPWFDNDQQNHGSVSNRQFSTSTPFSTQELFQPKPRPFKY